MGAISADSPPSPRALDELRSISYVHPTMMGVRETAESICSGQQSAVEATEATLQAVERLDGQLNALLAVHADRALDAARAIDDAVARGDHVGPLAGVPIVVKDNICTSWGTTTCGSRMLENFRAPYDAHVIDLLQRAGAVIVGKTNLDEFAMGSSTENSAFKKTRNPWNLDRVSGGSSGGSAVAVAARMVPAALGSDTGGSIRQPAALCGVVGLKNSYGRVSRYGLVAFASSLDQIGPLATSVADVAAVNRVICGHDGRDSTSADQPVPDYPNLLDVRLRGLRIGVAEEYFGPGLDRQVKQRVSEAIDLFQENGAEVIEIHLPHMKYAIACYYLVATAEASSNLARYDGVHYGHRVANPEDVYDVYAGSRGEGFGSEVIRRILLGTYALSSGYYDAYYLKALKVRTLIRRDFEQAFSRVDFIASPVTPTTAFPLGEKVNDPLAMYLADVYTISANLAGNCAISVPCGFDEQHLPVGLQLIGPAFAEERLLAVAHQYQCMTDFHRQVPPLAASTPR